MLFKLFAAYNFNKYTKKFNTQFKKTKSYKLGLQWQQKKTLKKSWKRIKKKQKKNTLETLGQSDDNVKHGML